MPRAHPARAAVLLAGACLLIASPSHADLVSPPRQDCPPGSRGATCHGGPHCEPLLCEQDSHCADGASCQDRRLCMGAVDCGSRLESNLTRVVQGSCAAGESCGEDPCLTVRVCVPPTAPSAAPPSREPSSPDATEVGNGSSCGGCAAVSGVGGDAPLSGVALGVLLLSALCLLAARRRR